MVLEPLQYVLGVLCGSMVGFTLGLFGGGGSILAVPLMVYVVGVPSPHMAIGTSASAVAANAFLNLLHHARSGRIRWRSAMLYSGAGVLGAGLGSTFGKVMDGQKLLALFALLMLVIAARMFQARDRSDCRLQERRQRTGHTLGLGAATGVFSGFFGIGGGFLIVPGLVAATGMPMLNAIGSSLLAVSAFGLTTATNYAMSGFVDWPLVVAFVVGGFAGGIFGARAACSLSRRKGALNAAFAGLLVLVAIYVLVRSI
jgi:uncharacterized protein